MRRTDHDTERPRANSRSLYRTKGNLMPTRRMVRMKCGGKASIARYVAFSSARRPRSEEFTFGHFMVSGGSIFFKTKQHKRLFMDNNIAFEQRYTATNTTECFKCTCWCLFGKEFSSDDAGDGPSCPFLGIHDDWTLGYESPPPSQLFIRCAIMQFYIYKGWTQVNEFISLAILFILYF